MFTAVKVFNGPTGSPFRLHRANILMQAAVKDADDLSLDELSNTERSDRHSEEEWIRLEEAARAVLSGRNVGPRHVSRPTTKRTLGQISDEDDHPISSR